MADARSALVRLRFTRCAQVPRPEARVSGARFAQVPSVFAFGFRLRSSNFAATGRRDKRNDTSLGLEFQALVSLRPAGSKLQRRPVPHPEARVPGSTPFLRFPDSRLSRPRRDFPVSFRRNRPFPPCTHAPMPTTALTPIPRYARRRRASSSIRLRFQLRRDKSTRQANHPSTSSGQANHCS